MPPPMLPPILLLDDNENRDDDDDEGGAVDNNRDRVSDDDSSDSLIGVGPEAPSMPPDDDNEDGVDGGNDPNPNGIDLAKIPLILLLDDNDDDAGLAIHLCMAACALFIGIVAIIDVIAIFDNKFFII